MNTVETNYRRGGKVSRLKTSQYDLKIGDILRFKQEFQNFQNILSV